jgi:hypothetical protein
LTVPPALTVLPACSDGLGAAADAAGAFGMARAMTVRQAATMGSADLMGMKNPCAERR